MVTGGVRVGHQDGRTPGGRQLENRSTRPPQDEVTGRQAVPQVGLVLEDGVPVGSPPGFEGSLDLTVVAVAGHVNDLVLSVRIKGEALDGSEVDRVGPVTPAENQQAGSPFREFQAPTGVCPICLEDPPADGATGDLDPTLAKAFGRKGEADSGRPSAQQPRGEAGAAVGLHQDERQAPKAGRNADRPGDEASSPDDDLCP